MLAQLLESVGIMAGLVGGFAGLPAYLLNRNRHN